MTTESHSTSGAAARTSGPDGSRWNFELKPADSWVAAAVAQRQVCANGSNCRQQWRRTRLVALERYQLLIYIMSTDPGIRTLLDLDGEVVDQEDGYWIKIVAWEVGASAGVPHGIRYSLTLHAPGGDRVLGYDNAHAVYPTGTGFAGRRLPYDHRHRHVADKGVPYHFTDAHQLLADFFAEVDATLRKLRST